MADEKKTVKMVKVRLLRPFSIPDADGNHKVPQVHEKVGEIVEVTEEHATQLCKSNKGHIKGFATYEAEECAHHDLKRAERVA
jgi:hypothetical protein